MNTDWSPASLPAAERVFGPEICASDRQDMVQCTWCAKCKRDGVSLSKCSACKTELYCSKECQTQAWPSHKPKCKMNRARRHELDTTSKALWKFIEKHRLTINECAIRALEPCVDPTRCLRDIFVLAVKPRPDSTRPETAFVMVEAGVAPMQDFIAQATQDVLLQENENTKRLGNVGSAFVFVQNIETWDSHYFATGFGEIQLQWMRPGMEWKGTLKQRLDEGILPC